MVEQGQGARLLIPPGDTISLILLPTFDEQFETRILDATLDVIQDLSIIVQPIAIELKLAFRNRESPFLEKDIFPTVSHYVFTESDVPGHIVIHLPSDPMLQISHLPQLTQDTLLEFLRNAFSQETLTPEYILTFESLKSCYTRSRLFQQKLWETMNIFPLQDGDIQLDIPIERIAEHLWVSGPVFNLSMYPAIAFEIVNYDGLLNTKIWVSWSKWAEPGTQEQQLLKKVVQTIVSKGWQPEVLPSAFKFD